MMEIRWKLWASIAGLVIGFSYVRTLRRRATLANRKL
jgi:hypothetical protein